MLSSRYLHLHEALGLGPMWLSREAKLLPAAGQTAEPERAAKRPAVPAAEPASAHTPSAAAQAPAARTAAPLSGSADSARAAIRAAIGKSNPPSAPTPPAQPAPAAPVHPAPAIEPPAHPLPNARLMVVSICPSPEDDVAGQLFSGEVGVLLDNMLAAVGLNADEAHKTSWLPSSAFISHPPQEELARALPRLQNEFSQCAPQALLLLGQFFQQTEQAEALAQWRGEVPAFTIPHPARLLRQPELKAQAWATLKQLRALLAQPR